MPILFGSIDRAVRVRYRTTVNPQHLFLSIRRPESDHSHAGGIGEEVREETVLEHNNGFLGNLQSQILGTGRVNIPGFKVTACAAGPIKISSPNQSLVLPDYYLVKSFVAEGARIERICRRSVMEHQRTCCLCRR